MFQFTRFASHAYVFSMRYPCGWVSPFGYLRIKANLPAPRSFSQAITSFIACNRQGIHHMHLVTCPYNFDGLTGPSVKDCLSAACRFKHAASRLPIFNDSLSCFHIEVCFDAIKMLLAARCAQPFTNGRFPPATLISTLRIFKEQTAFQLQTSTPPGQCPRRRSGLQPEAQEQDGDHIEVVEDDGIEPTTPCLQSRCSP